MKADLKTISLNQYYLMPMGLNSVTLYYLENGIKLFGEIKCLFQLFGNEILKEMFKYINKCFFRLITKVNNYSSKGYFANESI